MTSYATVIAEEGHPTRLLVAARSGSVIQRDRLNTMAPNWETARAEAQQRYPDRVIVIPRLGENTPRLTV